MIHINKWIKPLILNALLFSSILASAGDREKSVELLEKGSAFLKTNGEAAFIDAINNRGMFHEGDIYVWAIRSDFKKNVVTIAHISKILVGRDAYDVKDAKGFYFIREIVKKAGKKNRGEFDYSWVHPLTKKVARKKTYFERVGNIIVLCGYYK